jgi:hypothetical protein
METTMLPTVVNKNRKSLLPHHHDHLFSFRRSVQHYKIQMDMEMVTIWVKQELKPLLGFTVSPRIFYCCCYWFQQMHYFNSALVQCLSLNYIKFKI